MEPNEQQSGVNGMFPSSPDGLTNSNTTKADEPSPSEESAVRQWTDRIKAAKKKWQPDFERMRSDMNFTAGFQWEDQEDLNDNRYVCNFVLRAVRQKVAQLYARDPKAVYRRRKRLDYQIWDMKLESLQMAITGLNNPASMALLMDYTHGRMQRDMVDRIGLTMEIAFRWMLDNQQPSFKLQMKQLVARVVTCGVGFIRLNFSRSFEGTLATSDTESTIVDRIKKLKFIVSQIDEGKVQPEDPRVQEAQALMASISQSIEGGDTQNVNERLVFDFPSATSVVVDPACRAIKGFVNAQWVAQEYILPVDYVNEWFELSGESRVKLEGGVTPYKADAKEDLASQGSDPASSADIQKSRVAVYEVFHLPTKSTMFICEGHKRWVKAPEALSPETNRFWPLIALTFNDVETDPGARTTIYPPSDVQLLRPVQKEWNRSRDALRSQRKANCPRYFSQKGILNSEDKDKLQMSLPNEVVEVSLPSGTTMDQAVKAFQPAKLDPLVYETQSLQVDIQATIGNQEVSEPVSKRETATGATINEQSRLTITSSNVDDLDDFLSDLAEASGEVMIRELSPETVQRVVGPGAAWPQTDKENFLNEVFLDVVAASSGRPNKALELSNWQVAAPILQSAGASPMFLVRETLKRLDDRLDPEEAFPLGQTGIMSPQQPQQAQAPPQSQQANRPFPASHRQQKVRNQPQPQG